MGKEIKSLTHLRFPIASMSQKHETKLLVLALIFALGVISTCVWLIAGSVGVNWKQLFGLNSEKSTSPDLQEFNLSSQANIKNLADVKNVPNGLFSYGGSTTWASIRKELDPAIQTVWPQFQLRYTDSNRGKPSSDTGIQMLLDNQLEFAQSSRPLKEAEYQQARDRGFQLKEIAVAIDGIVVAVNPNLDVSGITVAQLNNIYAGKITNWNQVGGPNLKIHPLDTYGKQAAISSQVELVATPTDALRRVAKNPGAIFTASAPLVISQCTVKPLLLGRNSNQLISPYKEPFVPLDKCPGKRNQINTEVFRTGEYPLSRRLVVVVKENRGIDQQAGEAYANLLLTSQGQELIEKAGFVRIR